MPITVREKKIDRQPLISVCKPPIVGPIAGAMLIAMPTLPIAIPRRVTGNTEKTVICKTGHITPVPIASRVRPTRAIIKSLLNHAKTEPTVKSSIEVITIWRVEKRRVKNAVRGTIIAIIS